MIKPSAALIRAIKASRQSRRMSPLTKWLIKHHGAISTAESGAIQDWQPLCDLAATEGVVDGNGCSPMPKRMARAWHEIQRTTKAAVALQPKQELVAKHRVAPVGWEPPVVAPKPPPTPGAMSGPAPEEEADCGIAGQPRTEAQTRAEIDRVLREFRQERW